MWHIVPQHFPCAADALDEPTQADICAEPIFRRATPDFVRTHGGDMARQFMQKLEQRGMVNERTRFMAQRSPFVQDAFPSTPNWHVDYMPGTSNNFALHISNPVRGAIACLCSREKIATTSFLEEGTILIHEPDVPQIYKGGEYLAAVEDQSNWATNQVKENIKNGTIQSSLLQPNRVYNYDSRNFHMPPQFSENGGYRMIFRMNTPPDNFQESIPAQDRILQIDDFYFTSENNGMSWKKHIVNAQR